MEIDDTVKAIIKKTRMNMVPCDEVVVALDDVAARIASLRQALRPFVEAYKKSDHPGNSDLDDEQPYNIGVRLGGLPARREGAPMIYTTANLALRFERAAALGLETQQTLRDRAADLRRGIDQIARGIEALGDGGLDKGYLADTLETMIDEAGLEIHAINTMLDEANIEDEQELDCGVANDVLERLGK